MNYKLIAWYVATTIAFLLMAGYVYANRHSHLVYEVEAQAIVIPPTLKKIGECESGGQQFKEDGSVVKGVVNSQDTGKYQINLTYHQKKAEEMGINLFTEEGNETYALHLYETEGTKPWNASKHCWLSTETKK